MQLQINYFLSSVQLVVPLVHHTNFDYFHFKINTLYLKQVEYYIRFYISKKVVMKFKNVKRSIFAPFRANVCSFSLIQKPQEKKSLIRNEKSNRADNISSSKRQRSRNRNRSASRYLNFLDLAKTEYLKLL